MIFSFNSPSGTGIPVSFGKMLTLFFYLLIFQSAAAAPPQETMAFYKLPSAVAEGTTIAFQIDPQYAAGYGGCGLFSGLSGDQETVWFAVEGTGCVPGSGEAIGVLVIRDADGNVLYTLSVSGGGGNIVVIENLDL